MAVCVSMTRRLPIKQYPSAFDSNEGTPYAGQEQQTSTGETANQEQNITYLVLIRTPHTLHDLLRFRLRNASLLSHDLRKHGVHLSSHIRCITTDVEISLLHEQLVDFLGVLLETVLYVDFAGSLAGEGGD